jgi:hypothetical protein
MTIVELTRFRVDPNRRDALLASRSAMIADFEADRVGFLSAALVELPGGEWLDIVRWRSSTDREDSRTKGPNLPGIASFFGLVTEVVSSEDGIETERSEAWPQQR